MRTLYSTLLYARSWSVWREHRAVTFHLNFKRVTLWKFSFCCCSNQRKQTLTHSLHATFSLLLLSRLRYILLWKGHKSECIHKNRAWCLEFFPYSFFGKMIRNNAKCIGRFCIFNVCVCGRERERCEMEQSVTFSSKKNNVESFEISRKKKLEKTQRKKKSNIGNGIETTEWMRAKNVYHVKKHESIRIEACTNANFRVIFPVFLCGSFS